MMRLAERLFRLVAGLAMIAAVGCSGETAEPSLSESEAFATSTGALVSDPVRAFVPSPARDIEVSGSRLVWSEQECTEGQPCRLEMAHRFSGQGTSTVLHDIAGGSPPEDSFVDRRIAADDLFVYWHTSGGEVLRTRSSFPNATPEFLALKDTPSATGDIAVDDRSVFWAEESSVGTWLYRTSKQPGYVVRDTVTGFPGDVSDLQVDGNGDLYFLVSISQVLCCTQLLYRARLEDDGDYIIERTHPFLQLTDSYAVGKDHIFIAHRVPGGVGQVQIVRVPKSDFESFEVLHTIDPAGQPEAHALQVAGKDAPVLLWQEVRGGSGPIFRMGIGDTAEALEGTQQLDRVSDMVVASGPEGLNLYFEENGTIWQLPVLSDPIQLDLSATEVGLEVIQTIQNNAHSVPLFDTSNLALDPKKTYVRAFARIIAGKPETQTVSIEPGMILHGVRGNKVLPGSPLVPFEDPDFSRFPIDRTSLANSWIFELPRSWAKGTIELRAEVNPKRTVPETDYSNNVAVREQIAFFNARTLRVEFVPVSTTTGVSSTNPTDLFAHFVRAQSLLPVGAFQMAIRVEPPMTDPLGNRYDMHGIHNWYDLNVDMHTRFLWTSNTGASGERIMRAAAVPSSDFGGNSLMNNNFWFVPSNGGLNAANRPFGGVAMAHEMGHEFGRLHIDCGGPPPRYNVYPYPDRCRLNVDNRTIGYDGLSNTLIAPFPGTTAFFSDLMTYADRKWVSESNYRRMLDDLTFQPPTPNDVANASVLGRVMMASSPGAAGVSTEATVSAQVLDPLPNRLVSGLLFADGTARLRFASDLTEPLQVQSANANILQGTVVSQTHELVARDGQGGILGRYPLHVGELVIEHMPSEVPEPFWVLAEDDPAIETLELTVIQTQEVVADLAGGSSPPSLAILSPTGGTEVTGSMDVEWSASDLDGNDLQYTVLFSNDGAATWSQVATTVATTVSLSESDFPGGTECYVQVVASDGVHSTAEVAGPFTVPDRAPTVSVLDRRAEGVSGAPSFAQSEAVALQFGAYDPEQGRLTGNPVTWSLTGPREHGGVGETMHLEGLAPGSYELEVQAKDASNNTDFERATLVVRPKQVAAGSMPVMDGACTDLAYATDTDPFVLRGGPEPAPRGQMLHTSGGYALCISGLEAVGDFVDVWFDRDAGGGAFASNDDKRVRLGADGGITFARGDDAGGAEASTADSGVLFEVSLSDDGLTWSVEAWFPEGFVGGVDNVINLYVAHSVAQWPQGADLTPDTWGRVALGDVRPNGQIQLRVEVGDPTVNQVDYVLTGAGTELSGSLEPEDGIAMESLAVPPGDYEIELSGVTTSGTRCDGFGTATIQDGVDTVVTVALVCGEGNLEFDVAADDQNLQQATYTLSGDAYHFQGQVALQQGTAHVQHGPLPEGSYELKVTGTTDELSCAGSTTLSVVATTTTSATVAVICSSDDCRTHRHGAHPHHGRRSAHRRHWHGNSDRGRACPPQRRCKRKHRHHPMRCRTQR